MNGLRYRGGALELGVMASWHLGMGLGVLVRQHGADRTTLEPAVRARYRDVARGEGPSLLEPGRPYVYDIDLRATSCVFQVGHRIGLQITSSNFPRWDRNPNTGAPFGSDAEVEVAHQTILHDRAHPSHVILSLV